jgi:cytochrome c553
MKQNLRILAAMAAAWIAILVWIGTVHLQAGQAPAAAPQPTAAPAQTGQAAQAAGGQRGGGIPGTESGLSSFQTRCSVCHNNPSVQGAPSASTIREMPPERIYDSLMTGSMQTHSQGLSDIQKRRIAEFMGGRPLNSAKVGDAKNMSNLCRTNPNLSDPTRAAAWNG